MQAKTPTSASSRAVISRSGCQDALRRRSGRQAGDIVVEYLLALEVGRAEHHGPTDLRADIDVGSTEPLAQQIGAAGERLLERQHHVVVATPADGALPLDLGPLHHPVEQGRLEAARAEEQPAIIGA